MVNIRSVKLIKGGRLAADLQMGRKISDRERKKAKKVGGGYFKESNGKRRRVMRLNRGRWSTCKAREEKGGRGIHFYWYSKKSVRKHG